MSILGDIRKGHPITPRDLRNRGFSERTIVSAGAGSKKNTTTYFKAARLYFIQWFPKDFEGHIYLDDRFVDVNQRCVVCKCGTNQLHFSPRLESLEELDMFVPLIINGKIDLNDVSSIVAGETNPTL